MRIMTIGASPYLLVRNGRMNADIIRCLKDLGHEVSSACWHHDEGYFLPEPGTGIHSFEENNGDKICDLYPFISHPEQSAPQVYEIMKRVAPEIVITIGDYKETDFLYAIKAMYPVFKWIAIVTVDCLYVNENHADLLNYADAIFSTTQFGSENLSMICGKYVPFVPYGPDLEVFKDNGNRVFDGKIQAICTSKNALASNIGNLVKAVSRLEDISLHLHTNLFDPGEFDLTLLIDRNYARNVELTSEFVSIKDGVENDRLNEIYNNHNVVIDCSVKSATALGMLEAMATGCIPIGVREGRVGEIINMMPKEFQFFVPSETYIGRMEEEFSVATIKGLRETFQNMKNLVFSDAEKFKQASLSAIEVAKNLNHILFLKKLEDAILLVRSVESSITLETF